jgi:hypothetical protein
VTVLALALGACGGDSDDAGVAVDVIAAAPEPESSLEPSPAVAKSGRVEMEVGRSEVADAAQAVVDLATSPKVGGFVTSSVVDLEDGYGAAAILVHVPNERFEQAVAGLGTIGEVTRQEMAGEAASEPGASRKERVEAAERAAYSPVDVAIAGRRPAPPPEKDPIERALASAKDVSLAIASGAILAAGVVVPVAAILLLAYLVWALVVRRLRLRWNQTG